MIDVDCIFFDDLKSFVGHKPKYVGPYRITDSVALEASMEVAGKFRLAIEAKLSSQLSIPDLRRHGENDRWHAGVGVASGNFIAAKVCFLLGMEFSYNMESQ